LINGFIWSSTLSRPVGSYAVEAAGRQAMLQYSVSPDRIQPFAREERTNELNGAQRLNGLTGF
jgi:hypothetical protein